MDELNRRIFLKQYNIPDSWEVEFNTNLRSFHPVVGRLCIHKCAFDRGFCLPPRKSVMSLLQYIGIAPAQLSPFGWRYLMGFIVCCANAHVEPSREVFDYFFTINRDPKSWISLTPKILKHKSLVALKEAPRSTLLPYDFQGGQRI